MFSVCLWSQSSFWLRGDADVTAGTNTGNMLTRLLLSVLWLWSFHLLLHRLILQVSLDSTVKSSGLFYHPPLSPASRSQAWWASPSLLYKMPLNIKRNRITSSHHFNQTFLSHVAFCLFVVTCVSISCVFLVTYLSLCDRFCLFLLIMCLFDIIMCLFLVIFQLFVVVQGK